ncbi:DNA methyltransferase [Pseudoalteromonas shioyasakiensis]|uniref:DNA methyltransferase n=1 Tax=Pseudoalteromonas shioyasakiensis TaxID=1190813 RepID=UPI0022B1A9BA|nr:DNA methyltransferase [Pseudoalteromonas shioyasakiensis]MCZ4253770.1 N-6 DNA methylase [Pseudoalteromonas shioyasakiensis]
MNISQIEEVVKKLVVDVNAGSVNKDEFVYQLMAAYGHRKTTIGRIKSGERNLADVAGEVRAKRHVYFKHCQGNNVLSDIDSMKKQPSVTREKIRFVIATDFNQFVALDTRTNDTLDIEFNDLGKHFDFFLPWAGMEKAVYQGENPADVKAAEKMAKLFDLIKADNFNDDNKHDKQALHNLNVFLTRLLFCFFAEDTGIFKQNQFSGELESHTKVDGTDVAEYLNRLFEVLNTPKDKRADLPDYLANFEFVNGGLFADSIESPRFSTKSRKMLIESGSELDWSDINPDIFGSMIQAVVHPDQRGGMGMHYTSVTNIMKVIEPLFLDELYAELENIEENIDPKFKPSRLRKLHDRIADIKIFDPACGSGNFLIIAFKELRKLEMEIIKRLEELEQNENQDDLFGEVGLDSSFSRIKLSQFYGIELDDFAHEVAILSLWLAEHQMNVEFKAEFGECEPALPLKQSGNILSNNALTMDWKKLIGEAENTYICGNPPYLGTSMQSSSQKEDVKNIFSSVTKGYKVLDYISCWFFKAADFISGSSAKAAFVTTSSVCQGDQVNNLWPFIYDKNIEIKFAYPSFLWTNNAKNKAAVYCSIVGLGSKNDSDKYLFNEEIKTKVKNINPYLAASSNIIVSRKAEPISHLPKMVYGNKAVDGGNLILSPEEASDLLDKYPYATRFVKKLTGSSEMIRGNTRYCYWIPDSLTDEAAQIPAIKSAIEEVRKFRLSSKDKGAQSLAEKPHQFRDFKSIETNAIVIPRVSSDRRKYFPVNYFDSNYVVLDSAQVIYNAPLWVFTILSSSIHLVWVKAVAGRLKNDFRYSSVLCWHTFPMVMTTNEVETDLAKLGLKLIEVRESFSESNLSTLYSPEKMPKALQNAHLEIDQYVDRMFGLESPSNDVRLNKLFDLYKRMTGGQNA